MGCRVPQSSGSTLSFFEFSLSLTKPISHTVSALEALAAAAKLHPKVIRNRLRLAFLAPSVTSAILVGGQPRALTLKALDPRLSLSWKD
jgi:hypothetical protein